MRRNINMKACILTVFFFCFLLALCLEWSWSSSLLFCKKIRKTGHAGRNMTSHAAVQPCRIKYVLLTTQRSGSTWTCSLLDQIEDFSCGGRSKGSLHRPEILINYSFLDRSAVSWSTYQKDLDNAFAEACKFNPAEAIGFKLMYNQLPQQFFDDGNMAGYFRRNNVSVLHLVREAKILKLASEYNNQQQINMFDTHARHTTNATLAEKFRITAQKMPWDNHTVDKMLALEKRSQDIQKKIHFMPHVANFYLTYESLLHEKERLSQIRLISYFLRKNVRTKNVQVEKTESMLKKLHESICSDRIENYDEFRTHERVRESRSVAACDFIQSLSD